MSHPVPCSRCGQPAEEPAQFPLQWHGREPPPGWEQLTLCVDYLERLNKSIQQKVFEAIRYGKVKL